MTHFKRAEYDKFMKSFVTMKMDDRSVSAIVATVANMLLAANEGRISRKDAWEEIEGALIRTGEAGYGN